MDNKPFKFSFWKDNKIAGAFQLSPQELRDRFQVYLAGKDQEWVRQTGYRNQVLLFVTEKEEVGGLQSVCEAPEIPIMIEAVFYHNETAIDEK